ncbi:MAG: hypothetical protein GXY83_30805 [Rhodopirellula sp.]|nr:hypothetical protein [Rhodopirellula sp.]
MAGFRTANEFRHDTEREAAEALVQNLQAPAQVVGNYVLPGRYTGGEIDLLVILAEGILVVEVKNWFGRIQRVGTLVEFEDGYSVPSPFPGLQYKTKMLRSYLVSQDVISDGVPVGGCLIYVGKLDLPDDLRAAEHVFSVDVASKKRALLQPLALHGRRETLDEKTITAVAEFLAEKTAGTETWRVGSFVLDEELPATEFTRQFVGRCSHIYNRDVLLRCWEIDPLAEHRKRAATLRKLEAEASALARLESCRCPALPIVYDAFRDPANFNVFWVAQEYIGPDTLATLAHRFVKDAAFRERVLAQLDDALEALGQAGIVHRNIAAEVISVGTDDRILLGGLEFSASADGHTGRRTVAHHSRQPPERLRGKADCHAGDVYAAGLMVLDLLVPGAGSLRGRLRRVEDRSIRQQLSACLDDNPQERPKSLERLRKSLREWRL